RFRGSLGGFLVRSFGYRYGFRLCGGFSFRLGQLVSSCFQHGLGFGRLLLSQLGRSLRFCRRLLSQFGRSLRFCRLLLSQLGRGIFGGFRSGRRDRRLCLAVHYCEITGSRYTVFEDNGVGGGLADRGCGHAEAVERLLRRGEDIAGLVEGPAVLFGLIPRLAEAEAEAMTIVLDADD